MTCLFETLSGNATAHRAAMSKAGLDEGLLQFSLSNLLYMKNPYSYKKCQ